MAATNSSVITTVADLVEALQRLDPKLPVLLPGFSCDAGYSPIRKVEVETGHLDADGWITQTPPFGSQPTTWVTIR